MKLLLTGHKGYIGSVAVEMFHRAGHEVVGLDTDFFGGCDFGMAAPEISTIRRRSSD